MNTFYENRASQVDPPQASETPFLAADSRVDGFLAMLGHEMRNPLSALSNALELWSSTTPDALELAGLRSLIQRQVEQLVRFSGDLVNAARGERTLAFRRREMDLKRTVEAACEEVRPYAECRGHTLTVNLPEEPMLVYGDALRLIQAVANLVQNAAKFSGRNGAIDVVAKRQGDWAAVTVRDNGAGIELHRLPSIFEAHPEQSREYGAANDGLGIGLPLVKKIVDEHGGHLTAQSDGLGFGSIFTVFMPMPSVVPDSELPVSPSLAIAHSRSSRQLPNQRILVVDDQRCLAGLLAKLLRSLGQVVAVSEDGASAIQIALDERPDIVFLDIVMRGLDGYEVARRLRAIPALDGVRLVAVSGHSDDRSKFLAFEAGFDDYLVKPVSISELIELLEGAGAAPTPCDVCMA
jgi:CheY-like chemotaxis protein/two-component sensor histidine kinase